MNSFEILRLPDKKSTAAEAGEYLNSLLTENKKTPTLLMLSSGSSLSLLEFIGPSALGENLTISAMDERFSQDPKINNFHQIQKTDFFNLALEAEASFFGTLPRNKDTMDSLAKRWENSLRKWREDNPEGIIIATLGMGADGHTQGILPYPESAEEFKKLFESEAWVTAYNAGNKNPYPDRITTTKTFFGEINAALGFVCGAEKKEALEKLMKKELPVYQFPAMSWHQAKNLKVFTDIQ